MALKSRIVATYASQLYVALAGVVLAPVYMRLMGGEGYGLIAFFTMIQSWFVVLDFGASATISREMACHLGQARSVVAVRQLLRSFEIVYVMVGLAAVLVLVAAADSVSESWLNASSLSTDSISTAFAAMVVAVAIRWMSGLYRGAISGLERQVWLGAFSVVSTTVRFVGVIPVILGNPRPEAFFIYQALVSTVEMVVLAGYTYAATPLQQGDRLRWSLRPLEPVIGFSASLAFTSAVWVFLTQADKIAASKILALQEYGYFSAAVLLASGVTLATTPLSAVLLPRLTRLWQQGDDSEFISLYRIATRGVAALAGVLALVLALFADDVLWVWTGDRHFAGNYANVLALYAIGNGFLAIAAFPYYLQYAKGDVRLHFRGNLVFLAVLLPCIVAATLGYGAIGASVVWAAINVSFFFFWTPIVHRRFAPGLHGSWLVQDVFAVLIPPVALAALVFMAPAPPATRFGSAAYIAAMFVAMIAAATFLGGLYGSLVARHSQK